MAAPSRRLRRAAARVVSPDAPETRAAADSESPSQNDETRILASLITPDVPRFVVDVGAYDGATFSNSLPLVADGWRAVLVEPNPGPFAKLRKLHDGNRRVTVVNKACGRERASSTISYLPGDDASLMGARLGRVDGWRTHDVEVVTLDELLAETGAPAELGVLLIDTEGHDLDVLRGFDLQRRRPWIVVTEDYYFDPAANRYVWDPDRHREKHRLLMDADYLLVDKSGANTIWVSAAHARHPLAGAVGATAG